MGLSNEEREALRAMLERMPDNVLGLVRESADRLLRDLQDTNSAFPATQEFLVARGLTNVRELDEQGKADLVQHLRDVLRRATN